MNYKTFNCITWLLNFVVISRKTKSQKGKHAKICKTCLRTQLTSFQEIKWLESWCIICLFILHKLSIRCPKRDSYQIERPLLEIIEKLKFVYFCHHTCIKKSSVSVSVYYCYSVTKPLHNVEQVFADDCGVSRVVLLITY